MTEIQHISSSGRGARRVAHNAVWLFINSLVRYGLTFVLYVAAARLLGASEYGRLNFALSLAALLSLGADLGLSDLLIREVASARDRAGQMLWASLVIRGVASLITMLVLFAVLLSLSLPVSAWLLIIIAGAQMIIALPLDSLAIATLNGLEKMDRIMWLGGLNSLLGTGLGVLALVLGWGAEGLSACVTLVVILHLLAAVVILRRLGIVLAHPDKEIYRTLLKGGMPFFGLGIATTIYTQLPYLLLEWLRGDKELGTYTAAMRLGNFMSFLPAAITGAIYPAFSRLHAQGRGGQQEGLSFSLRALWAVAAPLSVVLIFMASPLISLILGKDYTASQEILPWVGVMVVFVFLNYPLFVYLNSIRQQNKNVWIRLFGIIIIAGAGFSAAYYWGAAGMAMAVAAGELVMLLGVGFMVQRCGMLPNLLGFLPALLAALAMAGIFWWLILPLGVIGALAIGVIVYLVIFVILGGISRSEFQLIRELLTRRKPAAE